MVLLLLLLVVVVVVLLLLLLLQDLCKFHVWPGSSVRVI